MAKTKIKSTDEQKAVQDNARRVRMDEMMRHLLETIDQIQAVVLANLKNEKEYIIRNRE